MIFRGGESDVTSVVGETPSAAEPFTDDVTTDLPESGFLSDEGKVAKADSATTESKSETSEVFVQEYVAIEDYIEVPLVAEILLHAIGAGTLLRTMKDWNQYQLTPIFQVYRWSQLFIQNMPILGTYHYSLNF